MTSYKPTFASVKTYLKIWSDRTPWALNLLSNLTEDEYNSRLIKGHRSKGLKSPKLSKALAQAGLPDYIIEGLLSTGDSTAKSHVVSVFGPESDEYKRLTVYHQSYSDHFQSCQHPSNAGYQGRDSGNYQVNGDWKDFQAGELFFWVVGDPKDRCLMPGRVGSEDGFRARAKLALVYSAKYKNVTGLYVDRVYGQSGILDVNELREWWDAFCVERQLPKLPIYEHDDDATKDKTPIYCNATNGYLDNRSKTIKRYREVRPVSLTTQVYHKLQGTWRSESEVFSGRYVKYNSFSVPPSKVLYIHSQRGCACAKEQNKVFRDDHWYSIKHTFTAQRKLIAKFVAACKKAGIDFGPRRLEIRVDYGYAHLNGVYRYYTLNLEDQTVEIARVHRDEPTILYQNGELSRVYAEYCKLDVYAETENFGEVPF